MSPDEKHYWNIWLLREDTDQLWEDITNSKPGCLPIKKRARRLVFTYLEVGGWARHSWKAILGEFYTCFEKSNYVF